MQAENIISGIATSETINRPMPNKRCPEVEEVILGYVQQGMSYADASMLAGVDESSFRRWRQCLDPRGFHGATKNDKRCWNCTGCALHQKTQQAELRCKQSCLTTILKAGEVKWQACAWFLERRYPTEYALRRVIDVSSQDARPNPYDNVRELLLGAGIITEETAVGIEEGIKEKPSTTPSVVTN